MLSKRLSPRLTALLLCGAMLCAVLVEAAAYYSGVREEARATARRHLPANYCISCHSDAHSMKVMLEKEDREGVPAHHPGGIFDPDAVGANALSPPVQK
jgi:hypothetical protein